MKEDKPIYESPRVFKLDETESAFGGCNPGSTPGDSCGAGSNADGACAFSGNTAKTECNGLGNTAGINVNPLGAEPDSI